MELKKSPESNLENKRGLFFELGLAVSLICAILAFSWSQEEHIAQVMTAPVEIIDHEIADITVQERTSTVAAVPARQIFNPKSSIIRIVDTDRQRSTTIDVPEFDPDAIPVTIIPTRGTTSGSGSGIESGNESNEPFIVAEDMPVFMGGGIEKFHAWVKSMVQYPIQAQEAGIHGRVLVSFVVEKDGSIGRIQILGSPDSALSDETVKVIKSSPKWIPAKQRGVPVPLRFNIPVDFQLQ